MTEMEEAVGYARVQLNFRALRELPGGEAARMAAVEIDAACNEARDALLVWAVGGLTA